MILSICIPTYNRAAHLPNCLNSILISKRKTNLKFEICISDNASNYNVKKIIKPFKKKLNIRLNRNKKINESRCRCDRKEHLVNSGIIESKIFNL